MKVLIMVCSASTLLAFAASAVGSALPVTIDAIQGSVELTVSGVNQSASPDANVLADSRFKTGEKGRVEFSVSHGASVGLGSKADLLFHSERNGALRAKLHKGRLLVDTRAKAGAQVNDVRLNAGSLKLRIRDASALVSVTDRSTQVCLIGGTVDVRISGANSKLEGERHCIERKGAESHKRVIPAERMDILLSMMRVGPDAGVLSAASLPPPTLVKIKPGNESAAPEAAPSPEISEPILAMTPGSFEQRIVQLEGAQDAPTMQMPEGLNAEPGESLAVAGRGDLQESIIDKDHPQLDDSAVVEDPPPATGSPQDLADLSDGPAWHLVLASMSTPVTAAREAGRLNDLGLNVGVREFYGEGSIGYRVGIGPFPNRDAADEAKLSFQREYPDFPCWISEY